MLRVLPELVVSRLSLHLKPLGEYTRLLMGGVIVLIYLHPRHKGETGITPLQRQITLEITAFTWWGAGVVR